MSSLPFAGSKYLTTPCDPLVPQMCGFPFPSNVYLVDDPSTATGSRVQFSAATLPKVNGVTPMDPSAWSINDGFSPGATMLAYLPNATTTGLANENTLPTSMVNTSPTILMEADTGVLVPHIAELDVNAVSDSTDSAFMIRPVVRLKDATRYIVAIRHVVDASNTPIPASSAFAALRDGTPTGDMNVESRRSLYSDIFARLQKAGVAQGDLQLAWDFTTASETNNTSWVVHTRDDALAFVGSQGPSYVVNQVIDNPNQYIRRRILGTMNVPVYMTMNGMPGGRLVFDPTTHMPTRQGMGTVPFEVEIPNAATSKPGAILQNGHGLLGSYREGDDGYLAQIAQNGDYVTIAVPWGGFSNDDIGIVTSALVGDIGTFQISIDRQVQGMVNALLAMRMMKTSFVSEPQAQFMINGKMTSVIDPTQGTYYRGDSQGGIFGTTYMAISTDVTRGMLGEPGCPYSLLLPRSADFSTFHTLLLANMGSAMGVQLAIGLMQMLWDRTEPDGYVPYITQNMLPNTPAHNVLLHVAIGDHQVTPLGAHLIARAVGASNVSPTNRDIFEIPDKAAPFTGSGMVEFNFGLPPAPTTDLPMTAGQDPHDKVRYLPDAINQENQFLRTGTIVDPCNHMPCQGM